MTRTRYMAARIALAFGISRRQRRMAEAASETHLLREAEQLLGQQTWERVEGIEELGIEYWNLRRLVGNRKELFDKLDEAEQMLHDAHEQRASLLSAKSEIQDQLDEDRTELLRTLESLAQQRDDIIREARRLRRLYDGLKTKLEVLQAENRGDELTTRSTKSRMNELRSEFESLKVDRDRIAGEIEAHNDSLDKIDGELDGERKKHREEAADAFQAIGESNRRISSYKAEIGLLETQMHQLHGEIGRHISRNTKVNAQCREATEDYQSMINVMSALRRSINLNHRLTGN